MSKRLTLLCVPPVTGCSTALATLRSMCAPLLRATLLQVHLVKLATYFMTSCERRAAIAVVLRAALVAVFASSLCLKHYTEAGS
jgi:hypothetical protein